MAKRASASVAKSTCSESVYRYVVTNHRMQNDRHRLRKRPARGATWRRFGWNRWNWTPHTYSETTLTKSTQHIGQYLAELIALAGWDQTQNIYGKKEQWKVGKEPGRKERRVKVDWLARWYVEHLGGVLDMMQRRVADGQYVLQLGTQLCATRRRIQIIV